MPLTQLATHCYALNYLTRTANGNRLGTRMAVSKFQVMRKVNSLNVSSERRDTSRKPNASSLWPCSTATVHLPGSDPLQTLPAQLQTRKRMGTASGVSQVKASTTYMLTEPESSATASSGQQRARRRRYSDPPPTPQPPQRSAKMGPEQTQVREFSAARDKRW